MSTVFMTAICRWAWAGKGVRGGKFMMKLCCCDKAGGCCKIYIYIIFFLGGEVFIKLATVNSF